MDVAKVSPGTLSCLCALCSPRKPVPPRIATLRDILLMLIELLERLGAECAEVGESYRFLWLKQLGMGCILYGLVLGMGVIHSTRETC